MEFIRKDAVIANNGGQFLHEDGSYTDLYWYAVAVGKMKEKPINDPTSWWFYAAIHGQYLIPTAETTEDFMKGRFQWKDIPGVPVPKKEDGTVDISKLPSQKHIDDFWDQCQHATWFFLPWHRGYLAAFEHILRDIIVKEPNAPTDWALPYWNYMPISKAKRKTYKSDIPPAFTQLYLPDGKTPNPLYVIQRYGPDGDGKISLEVGYPTKKNDDRINDNCQFNTVFSRQSGLLPPKMDVYGGPQLGFSRRGASFGVLEFDLHNNVHGLVGGSKNNSRKAEDRGLMSDTGLAALDPIFYLHHCNIDRMWKAWNETGHNENTNDPNWLEGPKYGVKLDFAMPIDAAGKKWTYTPKDMNCIPIKYYDNIEYDYTYDNLSLTTYATEPVTLVATIDQRLARLGADKSEKDFSIATDNTPELVGRSNPITFKEDVTETALQLDNKVWKSVLNSLLGDTLPNEIFLQIEGVKGAEDDNFLAISVNDRFVKTVSLFGIHGASTENMGHHGGDGLTFNFNISHIIDEMHLSDEIDVSSLKVEVKVKKPLLEESGISIGRISIYRLEQ